MKRLITIAVSLVFLLALLSFTVTYTVRFTESAVVTTFGRAGDGAITDTPGLNFKWPYPIQSVTKYDTRVRFLETRIETQQTSDDRQIAVRAFCLWRVSNPEAFFRNFSDAGSDARDQYRKAEDIIDSNFRAALAETSSYSLGDLFTTNPDASKIPDLEARILASLIGAAVATGDAQAEAGSLADAGIEIVDLGVNNIRLPEATTGNVIARMSADRDRRAQELRSQGQARADVIRALAENDAETIRFFANRRADEIIALGEIESAPYLEEMAQQQDLAVFLRQVEFVKQGFAKNATLVFPFEMRGMELLNPANIDGFSGPGDPLPGLAGQMDTPDEGDAQDTPRDGEE